MSTPSPSQPSETTPTKKKLRSPSYPYLDLSEATRLAKILWEKEKRHPAPVSVVAVHWNYGAKSSTGLLAVAALKKFGLLDEEGSGDHRTVKLSDFALDIIKHEDSPGELSKLLKTAALKPEIHRDLWENHREASDANIKRVLIFDKKFNDASVDSVIKEYRDTIAFAKLSAADTVVDTDSDHEDESKRQEKPPEVPAAVLKHPKPPVVAPPVDHSEQRGKPPVTANLRYLPIPLDIGDAPIPVGMSEDDFDLLLDTLKLWKKKIVRATASSTLPPDDKQTSPPPAPATSTNLDDY